MIQVKSPDGVALRHMTNPLGGYVALNAPHDRNEALANGDSWLR